MKLLFWIEAYGQTVADAYPFETEKWVDDIRWAAEEFAEEYHSKWDGWEDTWPVTLSVQAPDGVISKVEVEREARPEFHGRVLE